MRHSQNKTLSDYVTTILTSNHRDIRLNWSGKKAKICHRNLAFSYNKQQRLPFINVVHDNNNNNEYVVFCKPHIK